MRASAKAKVASAIATPFAGRVVGRLSGESLRVHGARIATGSPLIDDAVRAKLAFGLYERAELRFVREHLSATRDVVELGSSIGVVGSVALRALADRQRLIAVEADSDLAQVARANFERNADGRSWALEVAAVSYPRHASFGYVRGAVSTGGRLSENDGESLDVDRLTLSDILERHGVGKYSLIADIEGAEAGIILDDAVALENCEQVIIELHDAPELSAVEMRSALVQTHGFSVRAARGDVVVLDRTVA